MNRELTPEEARRLREQVIYRPPGGGSGPPPQHYAGDPGCFLVLFRMMSFTVAAVIGFLLGTAARLA